MPNISLREVNFFTSFGLDVGKCVMANYAEDDHKQMDVVVNGCVDK